MIDMVAADTIVINADVRTSDPAKPLADAFAIKNGRFLAVGTQAYIESLKDSNYTQVLDLAGATVLPGLIDSHTHLVGGVELAKGVDLFGSQKKNKWLSAIKEAVSKLKNGEWLFGGRWDLSVLDADESQSLPSRHEVDITTGATPMALRDIDFHSLWLNTAALDALGINESTEAPEGGELVRDSTGTLTGELKETAVSLVESNPVFKRAYKLTTNELRDVISHFNSIGVTATHDMNPNFDLYEQLLSESEPIPMRIWFGYMLLSPDQRQEVDFLELRNNKRKYIHGLALKNNHKFEFGYIKLVADGTLSNYTAALMEEYSDRCVDHFRGEPITNQEELIRLVKEANSAGFPVSIHAIGDRGVKMALNAFEAGSLVSKASLPNRMEHIEALKREDIHRFSQGDIVASMQPNHAIAGGYQAQRLGPERLPLSYAWQTLLSSGARVVFGSDWPTAYENPVSQLSSAVLRKKYGKAWFKENALSFDEALYAYTQAPAKICGWESEIGSIAVGKSADFVALPRKLVDLEEQNFETWNVSQTWLAGECIYSAPKEEFEII